MKTVFKYELEVGPQFFSLELPVGWKKLKVGFQGSRLFMWAEVNPTAAKEVVHFAAYGTGHELPEDATYFESVQLGPFFLHLYRLVS